MQVKHYKLVKTYDGSNKRIKSKKANIYLYSTNNDFLLRIFIQKINFKVGEKKR